MGFFSSFLSFLFVSSFLLALYNFTFRATPSFSFRMYDVTTKNIPVVEERTPIKKDDDSIDESPPVLPETRGHVL